MMHTGASSQCEPVGSERARGEIFDGERIIRGDVRVAGRCCPQCRVRSGAFGLVSGMRLGPVAFSAASLEVAGDGGSFGDGDDVVDVAAGGGHVPGVGVADAVTVADGQGDLRDGNRLSSVTSSRLPLSSVSSR